MTTIQIFNVEHGACSLLTADNGARLMIDCGHNATTGWKPGRYLRAQNISTLEMLAVTNYDEDHVSGIDDLLNNVDVRWLLCNKTVSGQTIKNLKREDGMGPGIDRLVQAMNSYTISADPQPVFASVERRVFYHAYGTFQDENNLSMVLFLKCHEIGVMFPGDLEKEGFLELLNNNQDFRRALGETNVYVASHHGREDGCCDELVQYLQNVFYVVISDKGYEHETQETLPFYTRIAKGGPFRGESRKILTTRNDDEIVFKFNPGTWFAR